MKLHGEMVNVSLVKKMRNMDDKYEYEDDLADKGVYDSYAERQDVKTSEEKQSPKEICKGFDSGKWNDDSNKCEFSKQGIKDEDDAEFDHYLSDEGLYEDYIAR